MTPRAESAASIAFGPFDFEPATGDIRKFGNRIRLQGKPLQILTLLLNTPNQIVSREELQQQLWGGTTFVDFEQGLNTAVNKLRQALGDSADQPRYIETVPGKGYRFIGAVHRAAAEGLSENPSLPRSRKPIDSRLAIGLAAALLVLSAALWFFLAPARSGSLKSITFTVTAPEGYAYEPAANRHTMALNPASDAIAFTAMGADGKSKLFLRRFDAIDPTPIPLDASVQSIFWPADGRSVYVSAGSKLRQLSLSGDAPQILADAPPFLSSAAWLSPGKILLSSSFQSFVATSSGAVTPISGSYSWPQLLPGGSGILHVAWNETLHRFTAHARDLGSPNLGPVLLESDARVAYMSSRLHSGRGYLFYVRSGNLLAQPVLAPSLRFAGEPISVATGIYSFHPTGAADFSVSEGGAIAHYTQSRRSQLAWVDRGGKLLSTLGPPNLALKSGRLSADAKLVASALYDTETGAQDLWIFDAATGDPRRLTLAPGMRDAPVWSPDGTRVAFMFAGGGHWPSLHIRGLGPKDEEFALPGDTFQTPTDWSPDGRYIVYSNTGHPEAAREAQGDVLLFDTRYPTKILPLLNSKFHESNASFSPNGRSIAFTSNESGRSEIYLQRFQDGVTGPRYPVTHNGALALRWRRDGKELFYLGFDGRVHAIPIDWTSEPRFGLDQPLFAISTEARSAIHALLGFDVSPDGKRFLIPIVTSNAAPRLVVTQNWEASLAASALPR